MTTLYDDLGVPPDASADELRRAYRDLARRLHPDLNAEPGSHERMGRINHAWTVLSEPAARERYDLSLRHPSGQDGGYRSPPEEFSGDPAPRPRWVRPSVVAVAVLTIIFVATAYAGPRPGARAPVTVPSTGAGGRSQPAGTEGASGLVDSALVGQCLLIQAGYDAIVPCSQHSDGLVIGQTTRSADCPLGTRVHQLIGRPQFVCLTGTTP